MAKRSGGISWYKDAVIYQLHVKTFYDSNGDGIGDFAGLTEKLPYLRELGVTAVWLLPFYPSPLKDDGYDIADYYDVNPQYGTLKDFRNFLRRAHALDLRVITELVINHTSDQHPWFERARCAPRGSKYRDYYVWSDTPDKYQDARIIFKDFEASNWTWDSRANSYYWHRFYSHQPDLNFDNPAVQESVFKAMDFWFSMGVDGMRLDAVPYLFEREGTNCENLPETHAFLKKLRKRLDSRFKDKMLLAEANQWPEDAAAYLGQGHGDECHMAFHFPLMPRMYMAVQMEDRFPILDILEQTPGIPRNAQWAIFLRNHDELTLEMVTDDERDYMYRAYAEDDRSKINLGIRRRLSPLLSKNRRKIELMNILLFSLPGTPIIYYGDEINMGDNRFLGDRDGVRTPMQWSPDRNAGFSCANPQQLFLPVIIDSEYHYETVNVETESSNYSSMLWWMRRVIAMRRNYKSLSCGDIKFLRPDNAKVLAFTRTYKDETMLVIINLSRFAQPVSISLPEFSGYVPREVFSQNDFPQITQEPYFVTMSQHAHFWFVLNKQKQSGTQNMKKRLPEFSFSKKWDEVFDTRNIKRLESAVLPDYLSGCRWFAGKSSQITSIKVTDVFALGNGKFSGRLLMIHIVYADKDPESYVLPVTFTFAHQVRGFSSLAGEGGICIINIADKRGILYDAVYDEKFQNLLLSIIAEKKTLKSGAASIVGCASKELRKSILENKDKLAPKLFKADQSNTSFFFGDAFFMKLFRKTEPGLNPDIEIVRKLSGNRQKLSTSQYLGHIEYSNGPGRIFGLAVMQKKINASSGAWEWILENVKSHLEHTLIISRKEEMFVAAPVSGLFLEMVALLGKRTAQMHLALAGETQDPDFVPESFSMLYQRSVYQSMSSQVRYVFSALKSAQKRLSGQLAKEVNDVVGFEKYIMQCFARMNRTKLSAKKIRIHGDYHLGQVLFTGKDFTIIDFEGEPARPLSERRLKRSALRDVAGMIRSFHYAAYAAVFLNQNPGEGDVLFLEEAADRWYEEIVGVFIDSYFGTLGKVSFLPRTRKELTMLLNIYLLDKAVYEVGYELNNRPDWLIVPLRGIKNIINK